MNRLTLLLAAGLIVSCSNSRREPPGDLVDDEHPVLAPIDGPDSAAPSTAENVLRLLVQVRFGPEGDPIAPSDWDPASLLLNGMAATPVTYECDGMFTPVVGWLFEVTSWDEVQDVSFELADGEHVTPWVPLPSVERAFAEDVLLLEPEAFYRSVIVWPATGASLPDGIGACTDTGLKLWATQL
jgi:hypothetical protein